MTISPALNRLLRIVITFALGTLTFVLCYHLAASTILHEPAIAGPVAGNALGSMDWAIVWLLLYAVGFDRWPVIRRR